MANSLFSCFKKSYLLINTASKFNRQVLKAISAPALNNRNLYTKTTLGLDSYHEQRERVKQQMVNISQRFKEKMNEYVVGDSKNMIFTEDLKNMLHIAENDSDLELVVEMLKKYNQQNSSLRFGNYIFGPVVMRLFYTLNKPDLALDCFKSPELEGLFDQIITYQLLLDLLFENKRYKEMLEVVDIVRSRQMEGAKYPKNVVVLALAACYKMNTQESFDYAMNLWKNLKETGHVPLRRAVTFFAGLALNQGRPEVALEILTHSRNQSYTTVRNIKVCALADVNRLEDIIPILKSILADDVPESVSKIHTFNREVIEKVGKLVQESPNSDLTVEFNRLRLQLEKEGRIVDMTLDEQLCADIQTPPEMSNRRAAGQRQQQDFQRDRSFQRDGPFRRDNTHRPGLKDLV